MSGRDYSKPSEAAKLRIMGATRIHCDPPYSWEDEEAQARISERHLARGSEQDEDVCDKFNADLRAGHQPLRR